MLNPEIENFFAKRKHTLDMFGLTDEQKQAYPSRLGSESFFVLGDYFEYDTIQNVVFRWGDPRIEEVYGRLIDHEFSLPHLDWIPFIVSTVVYDELWSLYLLPKDFSPETEFNDPDSFVIAPFDENLTAMELQDSCEEGLRHRSVLGRIANRYVLFTDAVKLSLDSVSE